MKRKHLFTAFAISLAVLIASCDKEDNAPENVENSTSEKKIEVEKLTKFLAWATSLPADSILFDDKTQIFYMHNSDMHEPYERVKYFYDNATEYPEK